MLCVEFGIEMDVILICKSENIFFCNECGRYYKLDDVIKYYEIVRF